ncbi:MAG: response regulator [Alphaproteobacteria bacterium]|nr:response regulator [Alphaproteobacteria bacterium]MBV9695135.1 response regulator [Alphaproteobacteria bacterium]
MPLHALVIDPDDRTRNGLARNLEALGLTVDRAISGEAGLRLAQRERPDLVILEIVMPGMDGVECMLAIRRLHPGTKFVAMTAAFGMFSAEFLLRVMERLGAETGLLKPISRRKLGLAVRAALETLTR